MRKEVKIIRIDSGFEVAVYYLNLGSELNCPPGESYAKAALDKAIKEGRVRSGTNLRYEVNAAH